MNSGLPYNTHDLDELRASQRRRLRAVPTWRINDMVTAKILPFAQPEQLDSDSALVEMELRSLAERDVKQLAEVFEHGERAEAADATIDYLRSTAPERTLTRGVLSDVAEELEATYKTHYRGEALKPELDFMLKRMVALLALADRLAGDYRDPRLPGPA